MMVIVMVMVMVMEWLDLGCGTRRLRLFAVHLMDCLRLFASLVVTV